MLSDIPGMTPGFQSRGAPYRGLGSCQSPGHNNLKYVRGRKRSHFMKDCKRPPGKVCFRCERPDHIMQDCTERVIRPPEDTVAAVSSTRNSDGEDRGLVVTRVGTL